MCDTIAALGSATKDSVVLFGKNSDREPDEVQNLRIFPAKEYKDNETVKCTFISIPQVKKTNRIFLCQPFWMFGGEMGANEFGVVIGNEAIFTNEKPEKTGLTGMDLIRLALERSHSAKEALEIIIKLLEEFGQGGNCGYRFKLEYMNSFIIADKEEAYVLETVKRWWIWKKIKDFWSISNIISIESDFDDCSKGLIEYAVRKKYCKTESDFNFKKSFSGKFMTWAAGGEPRECRTRKLLNSKKGKLDTKEFIKILRDHNGTENYQPDKIKAPMVCFHSANKLFRRTQSVCSMAANLSNDNQYYYTTGSSNPCLSPYFPVFSKDTDLPKEYSAGSEFFDSEVFWWRSERMHRNAVMKYKKVQEFIKPIIKEYENNMLKSIELNKDSLTQ